MSTILEVLSETAADFPERQHAQVAAFLEATVCASCRFIEKITKTDTHFLVTYDYLYEGKHVYTCTSDIPISALEQGNQVKAYNVHQAKEKLAHLINLRDTEGSRFPEINVDIEKQEAVVSALEHSL